MRTLYRTILAAAMCAAANGGYAEPKKAVFADAAQGGGVIRLGGNYAGHLQDVWRDGNVFYWAHTLALVKTDLSGNVLAKTDVNEHHAGLEVRDGKVYVAVCDMQDKTGGKTLPDSRVTVKVYDAETLKLLESHVTDINDRSGSLAILEDGTFLVGCLRPPDISETQVRFHHLDGNFKLIKSYVLDNVPVPLGIETIRRHNGYFYLSHYTKEALHLGQRTGKSLCIKLDRDFREVARYDVNGTCGLVFDGDSIWVGATWREPGVNGWVSSLNRVDPPSGFFGAEAADLEMHRNDEWRSVPVERVRLEGPLGRRIALTATNNLMKIDLEKDFFGPFRKKTGGDGGFIGIGKLLDGAAYLAKYTGFKDVVERKREIARVLADTQDADGYIGYFAPEARMRKLWDLHEIGFILQGLVSDWELFGEMRSLEAARKAADYVMRRWPDMQDGWEFDGVTDRETTLGLAHGFIRLAAATGETKYLDFAKNERALMDWNAPIVLGRSGMIYGQAYGFLGTALEQLELYGREANPKLLRASFRGLRHMTRNDGLLIDGTGGIAECWTDDQDGEGSVGETCLIAFQFLFYDRLLRLGQGSAAQIGDLMERLACNALPAAQSRDGRRLRYYTPLNGERKYFETDAYCCPNNFRRAMGRLPGYVYYEKDGAILANLFEASRAQLDVGTAKVEVKCETDYPASGKIAYTLEPESPAQFAFMFRLPKWCKSPRVEVNGKAATYPCRPGEILSLPRVWKKGDRVSIDFPMEIRCVKGRKRQSGRFAVMRGPLLYALDTRRIKGFEKEHPLDAATVIMLDPAQLEFKAASDGGRSAFCGTAIATRCTTVDYARWIKPEDPEILLTEFADEDDTLTYFRTPVPDSPLFADDELFGGAK